MFTCTAVTSKLCPEHAMKTSRVQFHFFKAWSLKLWGSEFRDPSPQCEDLLPTFSLEDHGTRPVQCTPSIASKTARGSGVQIHCNMGFTFHMFETTQDSSPSVQSSPSTSSPSSGCSSSSSGHSSGITLGGAGGAGAAGDLAFAFAFFLGSSLACAFRFSAA